MFRSMTRRVRRARQHRQADGPAAGVGRRPGRPRRRAGAGRRAGGGRGHGGGERRRARRPGRRALRDGARRRPGPRGARPRRSARHEAGLVVRRALDGRAADAAPARGDRRPGTTCWSSTQPVSGGADGRHRGDAGDHGAAAPRTAYAAARPVLERMGTQVVHAGPIGAGTQMKLARNMMHFVAFTAATEAQRLAEAAGLDLVELGDVVRHTDAITGGPGAIMHRDTTAPLAEDDFWFGVFTTSARWGRRTSASPSSWPTAGRRRTARARGAASGWRRGWDSAHDGGERQVRRPPERDAAGLERMEEVYGFDMTDGQGDFFGYTADHLFADIWNRPGSPTGTAGCCSSGCCRAGQPPTCSASRCRPRYATGELDEEPARDRDLPVPLRRLAHRRPGQPDRRGVIARAHKYVSAKS